VRILVRPGSAYQPLVQLGAEAVFGDLKDPASLLAATRGAAAVISTANSALRGGADTVETVDLKGNQALIAAAVENRVSHFTFVTGLATSVDSPIPFMAAKAKTEAALKASGLAYTIVACNLFMDVWAAMPVGMPAAAGRLVTLVGEGRRRHSFVAIADVAEFVARSVDFPAAKNAVVAVGGPRPLSFRDIVAAYEKALGHTLQTAWLAPGQPVPGLPGPMSDMLAGLETYDSPMDMERTAAEWGVALTPIERFVSMSLVR
jgi:NADH dehydrogenase